eukprot:Rmarinus@m.12744
MNTGLRDGLLLCFTSYVSSFPRSLCCMWNDLPIPGRGGLSPMIQYTPTLPPSFRQRLCLEDRRTSASPPPPTTRTWSIISLREQCGYCDTAATTCTLIPDRALPADRREVGGFSPRHTVGALLTIHHYRHGKSLWSAAFAALGHRGGKPQLVNCTAPATGLEPR